MTLIAHILKKVQSKDSIRSVRSKYSSPPPELDDAAIERRSRTNKRKRLNRYRHVRGRIDTAPPFLQPAYQYRNVGVWTDCLHKIYLENFRLLAKIRKQYYSRGKVDCHWDHPPPQPTDYYQKRRTFLKRVLSDNKTVYKRILAAEARVTTTASLEQSWERNRRRIVAQAHLPFVLFPSEPAEDVDPLFVAPPGVERPRVRMSLRAVGNACLGWLTLELFTDVCPLTCRLFAELLSPDAAYTYIGTSFFTKVPQLYWSGGDVVHDNGFGCYMQRGRTTPLGAENYHFPHSMPGLLSMRMTCDDEMCGIFNITFKPLPQFDLKNIVFARVVRPSGTYDTIASFGSALSTHPVVRIESSRLVRGRALLAEPAVVVKRNTCTELLEQTAKLLESMAAEKIETT